MEGNFNSLALEFVKELSAVFPEEKVFEKCVRDFDAYEPKKWFMEVFGPHQSLIMAKDETLFDKIDIPGSNIKNLWNSVSHNTKESIWSYGSTLSMLASALENTPKELMNNIETMAQEFAEKMQTGDLDMTTLFSDVMNRVQQMDLSSMKDIDIGSLTKSMGIDPNMISGMLGGVDPSMIQNMMGLMGGNAGEEEDLLKLLETAKPPSLPKQHKKKHKSESSKKSSKKSKK